MSLALGQIGYFQLINLMRNKVPFRLVLLDLPMDSASSSALKPIWGAALSTQLDELIKDLECHKITHSDPIVLLCQSGEKSKEAYQLLQSQGFLNAYSVKDGLEGLLQEEQRC